MFHRLGAIQLVLLMAVGWPAGHFCNSDKLLQKFDCFDLNICGRLPPASTTTTAAPTVPKRYLLDVSRAKATPQLCESCALRGEFPWYARLELHFGNETSTSRYCGATVIDRLFLLTSASCVKRPALGMARRGYATLGLQNLMESPNHWQVRSIANLCGQHFDPDKIYSNFTNLSEFGGDITVVKLNATLHYNERVAPICLRDPNSDFEWNPEKLIMAGFGIYDDQEKLPPSRLSKHLMQPCYKNESKLVAHRRRPDQFCAIDAKHQGSPCDGDQGNGIYAQLPLKKRMGLHSILGLPVKSCQPGHVEPVLSSELTLLKVQIREMLAGCS